MFPQPLIFSSKFWFCSCSWRNMELSPAPQQSGSWLVHGCTNHNNSSPLDYINLGLGMWCQRDLRKIQKRFVPLFLNLPFGYYMIVQYSKPPYQIITVKEANRNKDVRMADEKDVYCWATELINPGILDFLYEIIHFPYCLGNKLFISCSQDIITDITCHYFIFRYDLYKDKCLWFLICLILLDH